MNAHPRKQNARAHLHCIGNQCDNVDSRSLVAYGTGSLKRILVGQCGKHIAHADLEVSKPYDIDQEEFFGYSSW